MAGSITVTSSKVGNLTKYAIDWTSDAAGAVSGNTFDVEDGELVQVRYTPDSGGTQPTDLYDVTLTDPSGLDILAGGGANLSNAAASVAVPVVSTYFRRTLEAGSYTPVVAAAGNAKGGLIELLVRPV